MEPVPQHLVLAKVFVTVCKAKPVAIMSVLKPVLPASIAAKKVTVLKEKHVSVTITYQVIVRVLAKPTVIANKDMPATKAFAHAIR